MIIVILLIKTKKLVIIDLKPNFLRNIERVLY